MRDKLHRVRSTDLEVLRSMLIDETHSDEKEPPSDDCNENGVGLGQVDDEVANAIVLVPRASVKTAISRTPVRPFLITRIGSKHRWHRPVADSSQEDVTGDESERQPLRTDLLATANRLWDQSLSEARRVFQDSLASHRLTSGCPGNLIETAVTVNPPGLSEGIVTARVARTAHRLLGDDPDTARWLQQKERERRRDRRQQTRQSLADSVERHEAHLRHEQRQEAARQAFKQWFMNKKLESAAVAKETAENVASVSSDCDEEVGPAQAGRQPRPSRKAYFRPIRCVLRPKSAVSFTIGRSSSKRFKVAGHRLIPVEPQVPVPPSTPLGPSLSVRPSGDFATRPTLRPRTVGPPPRRLTSTEPIGQSLTRKPTNGERTVVKQRKMKSRRKSTRPTMRGMIDGLETEKDPLSVDDEARPAAGRCQSQTAGQAVQVDGDLSSVSICIEAPSDTGDDSDDRWDECSLDSAPLSEN